MAVITISRQFGAGGKTLCKMLAKELDYKIRDEFIIQEISAKARVSEDWVKSMERTAGGPLSKFISGMVSRNYVERIIGDGKGYLDEEVYVETLREVILKLAEEDNVILVGRGSQYILKDFAQTFHFQLVADKEDRIKFMQKFYKLSTSKAEQAVLDGQKRRSNLYKKLGKKNYDEPHHYHMIINTSKLSLEETASQICLLVRGS